MSSPGEFLINQHTDTTDARLIRTTKHLREEDLTDADAPGESDEPLINQSRRPRAPEHKAGRRSSDRPRQARAPSPHPRAPSPIPTVSKRRPPTAAERAVASDYVRELQDELDTIWLSRNHKKEIQMKIRKYNQIAEGGFIEAPFANSPNSRRFPATQTMHAQSRASSVDPNGNRSPEREFLQRQREEYIRDNPQFFKTSRREPNSKVDENDYELAAAYTPRPSKQRRRNCRGEEQEESDCDIYAPAAIAPLPTKQRRQKRREEEEQADRNHYATAAVSSSSRPRKQRRQESYLKKAEEEAETERDDYKLVARYLRQQNLERKKKTSQKARASEPAYAPTLPSPLPPAFSPKILSPPELTELNPFSSRPYSEPSPSPHNQPRPSSPPLPQQSPHQIALYNQRLAELATGNTTTRYYPPGFACLAPTARVQLTQDPSGMIEDMQEEKQVEEEEEEEGAESGWEKGIEEEETEVEDAAGEGAKEG